MEEKKLNLKPFDIQKAREGKPVCTRDGRKARIICFDIKGYICPIVAAIEENGVESTCRYNEKGQNYHKTSDNDLMMLPEKYEGWINIYKSLDCRFEGRVSVDIYKTKEQALKEADNTVLDTIKIEWEE